MTQKEKRKLESLNLVDRFLFDETMELPGAYEATVSILLEREMHLLDRTETEKELRVSPQLRAVRLDVISMDADGQIYYTEMQGKDTKNLVRRSRYYQAQLDVSLLPPGEADFNRLNDTCFILIAPFDIFGKGLYRYTFEGVCRECPELKLEDGACRIFINTQGTNGEEFSREFLDFMKYITESTDENAARSNSEKIRLIHQSVCSVKQSEKMGVKYMQLWEEKALERESGRKEGRKEGQIQGTVTNILDLLATVGEVPEELSKKVEEETDLEKLRQWLLLAARVKSVTEFAEKM